MPAGDVQVNLSVRENPDQDNVKTQFLSPDGTLANNQTISIGRLGPGEESMRQSFKIQIARTMGAGSLQEFQLVINFNPTYRVIYAQNQEIWKSPSEVIPQYS